MARGDHFSFNEFYTELQKGTHDLDGDTFSARLITTLPTVGQTSPTLSDFTECSAGGNYATGGIVLSGKTVTNSGTASLWDSSTTVSWLKAAGSPTNAKAILISNDSKGGAAVSFIDLTTDGGTTAVSLVDNDITMNFSSSPAAIIRITRTA